VPAIDRGALLLSFNHLGTFFSSSEVIRPVLGLLMFRGGASSVALGGSGGGDKSFAWARTKDDNSSVVGRSSARV
jgi:hypothetical protein